MKPEIRESVDAHLDEIVISNVEDAVEEMDLTEELSDEQVQSLFDAFEKEDWNEVDRIIDEFDRTGIFQLMDEKAGGPDKNRGGADKLRKYWTVGKGGAKIRWGSEGDWTRCVTQLSKYLGPRAKGYCALRHKEMNGIWPGDKQNKSDSTNDNLSISNYYESKTETSADIGENMLEHKTVGVKGMNVVSADEGIVETIISVTGIVDNVKDRIMPGAYQKTLVKRKPKGVWSHDWDTPVSKTLDVKELMPGDSDLPFYMPDGDPWPTNAGALKVKTQFNLETQRGREAYSDVVFFGDEQEWSIGYNVPLGGAKVDSKSGVREITMLELYEYSPVLFGAMPLARTTSVKDAQMAYKQLMSGGAASWLSDSNEKMDEPEDDEEYTSGYEDEEDDEEETEGKSYDLAADQMILVKRAIESLSDLLEVVQFDTKMNGSPDEYEDEDEDEPEESDEEPEADDYDSVASAVDDLIEDDDLYQKLMEPAGMIDTAMDEDDNEAIDNAVSDFLDVVEEEMGGDNDDVLKSISELLADMLESMDDGEMPSEETIDKKGMCPMCGKSMSECKCDKKRMYSDEARMKMAEEGIALPDGSYPIKDGADLQNAISAFGRAKDKEACKKHIMKRAKALDMEDMIPESWMGEKSLIDMSEMKTALASLSSFNN